MATARNTARIAGTANEWIYSARSGLQRSNVGASSSRNVMGAKRETHSTATQTTTSAQSSLTPQRAMHSSASASAPSTATSRAAAPPAKPYPFAASALVRTTEVETNANMSTKRPKSRGVMASLHAQMRKELDPTQRFTGYFARNSPTRIPVGSVLIAETYTNAARTGVSSFSGILIAIRRRGVSTSFVLRNLVNKMGVEVMFNVYSPLLKDIRIVQRATGGKDDRSGKLRRARRAKLYYLRNDNRKLTAISKSIVVHRQQQEAERAKGGSGQTMRRLR